MIKTNSKYNFTTAEDETFSWSSSEKDFLTHKPTGKKIYQMKWYEWKNSQPITDQSIRDAVSDFLDELWDIQDGKREARQERADEKYARDCERRDAEIKRGLCPKCGSYCYGDCEANGQ